MPQGYWIPLPQRLFDADGAPAVGWKISYTVAGTSTPVTTYSDAGLSSENTDPVVTDASGYFRAFVAEAVIVDIVVTDENDVEQFTLEDIEAMPDTSGNSPSVTAVPTGGILAWSSNTAPTGFLLCNGAAVSRATYSDLNALYAAATPTYPYGNGDGSSTFNLPDLRGAFVLGVAASGTGDALGETGGDLDHTHTGPSHTHVTTIPRDNWGQTLNAPADTGRLSTGYASGTGQFSSAYQATGDQDITSAAGGTGNTGSANPPFVALNWIVKT